MVPSFGKHCLFWFHLLSFSVVLRSSSKGSHLFLSGCSALICAVGEEKVAVVKLLVEAKADVAYKW